MRWTCRDLVKRCDTCGALNARHEHAAMQQSDIRLTLPSGADAGTVQDRSCVMTSHEHRRQARMMSHNRIMHWIRLHQALRSRVQPELAIVVGSTCGGAGYAVYFFRTTRCTRHNGSTNTGTLEEGRCRPCTKPFPVQMPV